jgi:hypothetical protein
MDAKTEARWGMAVRVLALVSLLLAVIAVLEGVTIRRLRSELQVLRSERAR